MQYKRIIITGSDGFFRDSSEYHQPVKKSNRLHLILFVLTVFSTMAAGSMLATGKNPFASFQIFMKGLPFSLTLLSILGVHEFAHYFAARYWGIHVTLPYFIPAPMTLIGTFGAVIKMKSSIPNRKALVDVGVSGPLAGFVVAVAACVAGLYLSDINPGMDTQSAGNIFLGESLLFKFLGFIVHGPLPDDAVLNLHPIAFAGWIGLFVTALNLLPIGQLDGGHVLFALSPKIHTLISRLRLPVLLLLGLTFWPGWYVWAALSFFFGRTHPYPDRMDARLGTSRSILAAAALIMLVLCFMPSPIEVSEGLL